MISSKRFCLIKYFRSYIQSSRGISVKAEPLRVNSRGVTASFDKRFSKYEKKPEKFEDTFGNLTEESAMRSFEYKEDPDDVEEMKRQRIASYKPMTYYIDKIQNHLKDHDYNSALNVLKVEMLKIDRKKPAPYIYDVLISYNGKIGNLKEAYKLYIELRKKQIPVNGGTYTSLFNAAANCDDRDLAFQRLDKIVEDMMTSDFHKPNVKNFNAMIKAYGRHGDIEMCLKIMDAVLKERGRVAAPTYSFLLQACITDKNSGLRHALTIWHKMLQNRTKPDIYLFRLMLRCVRDCSLGPVELIEGFVNDILKYNKGSPKKIQEERKIHELDEAVEFVEENKNLEATELEKKDDLGMVTKTEVGNSMDPVNLPNLLLKNPVIGSAVKLNHISTPQDRFLLLGGFHGFMKAMKDFGIKPCDRIVTQLLDVIPNTMEAEEELIKVIDEEKIEVKTSFVNVLLKRRIFRNEEKQNIKDSLKLLQKYYLTPDVLTFGILALSCNNTEEGSKFLTDLRNSGFRLNAEIAGALLYKAAETNDLKYAKFVMNSAKEDEVVPNATFLKHLKRIVQQNEGRFEDSSRFQLGSESNFIADNEEEIENRKEGYDEDLTEIRRTSDKIEKYPKENN